MNMVINKRHIILAALVLALGVAVYLNFVFADSNKLVDGQELVTDKNYGDAEFVENGGDAEANAAAEGDSLPASASTFAKEKTR